jgi:hypothetical protein
MQHMQTSGLTVHGDQIRQNFAFGEKKIQKLQRTQPRTDLWCQLG